MWYVQINFISFKKIIIVSWYKQPVIHLIIFINNNLLWRQKHNAPLRRRNLLLLFEYSKILYNGYEKLYV